MQVPDTTDMSSVISAVGRGDPFAMRNLVTNSRPMLLRTCFKVVRDRSAAEDVLQDVYLKVWHRAPSFSPQLGGARAWLTTIARNTALDWVRARTRERRGMDRLAVEEDRATNSVFRFTSEGDQACAMNAVDGLDDLSRNLIHDAFVVGLTYAELADRRGLPLGTVKSRIRRGLIRVREDLAA